MEDIKLAFEAIGLYQTQYEKLVQVWQFFSVVTLAVVGFVIGSDRAVKSFKEPIAIVCAYLVVCFGNHRAVVTAHRQLEQLAAVAIRFSTKADLDVSTIKPLPADGVALFHSALIIAVSIGILVVAWFRKKQKQAAA